MREKSGRNPCACPPKNKTFEDFNKGGSEGGRELKERSRRLPFGEIRGKRGRREGRAAQGESNVEGQKILKGPFLIARDLVRPI